MANAAHLIGIFLGIVALMMLLRAAHMRQLEAPLGTFQIRDIDGNVTDPIPYNASIEQVQAAVKRSGLGLNVKIPLQHEASFEQDDVARA